MNYKNVIFDLDGTIINSAEGIAKAFKGALNLFDVDDDLETIKGLIGPPLQNTIREKYKFKEEHAVTAMEYFNEYLLDQGLYECSLFDGMGELLENLKGKDISLSIATSAPKEMVIVQLKHLGAIDFFDKIEGNNIRQDRGSKAQFIKMVLDDMEYSKPSTIMIGDKEPDISGGKKNSLDTIGVLYGYGSSEEIENAEPTYIANKTKEIENIVLK